MAAKTQVVRRLNRQQMSSPSLKKEMREEIIGKRVSPELWGVKEAVEWVEKLIEANKDDTTNFVAELQELRDAFEKHSVTGRVLQLLDKEGLRELGLNSYVHCARLLSALEITRAQAQAEGTKRPGIFASLPDGVADAQTFVDILERIEGDPKAFGKFLHPEGIQGLFSKTSAPWPRWFLKFVHLMGNQDLFLFTPLAITFAIRAVSYDSGWWGDAADDANVDGGLLKISPPSMPPSSSSSSLLSSYDLAAAGEKKETTWFTENMSICIFGVLNIIFYRLCVPLQYRLAEDLFENIDLSTDVKENVRSSWTNTALVSALLLTFAFPMAQVNDPMINYLCATVSAIVSAIVSMLVPTITLLYTEHLSTDDAINFFLCYCWTITLPIVYTGVSALWLLIALGLWMGNQYGAIIGVYAFVSLAWCFWRVAQVWVVCSDFAPEDKPVPARGGKWNPYNRATKVLALKMLKLYAARRTVLSEQQDFLREMSTFQQSARTRARVGRGGGGAPAVTAAAGAPVAQRAGLRPALKGLNKVPLESPKEGPRRV